MCTVTIAAFYSILFYNVQVGPSTGATEHSEHGSSVIHTNAHHKDVLPRDSGLREELEPDSLTRPGLHINYC